MDLSVAARMVMDDIAVHFVAAGLELPWHWRMRAPEVAEVSEELIRGGLLAPVEGDARSFSVTPAGREWVLDQRGLVCACCPRCSAPVYLPKGEPKAPARCSCSVTWTEDTTAVPFVSRY